jgi:hypothetical protein
MEMKNMTIPHYENLTKSQKRRMRSMLKRLDRLPLKLRCAISLEMAMFSAAYERATTPGLAESENRGSIPDQLSKLPQQTLLDLMRLRLNLLNEVLNAIDGLTAPARA